MPIDPCGSIMDWLRSGYQTQVYAFNPDGTPNPQTITWQKAPAGATLLGVRHQYSSGNYYKGVDYLEEVGEVMSAPRPWKNGATTPGLVGTNHCGSAWQGELTLYGSPQSENDYGLPLCCNIPNLCQQRNAAAHYFIDFHDGNGPQGPLTNVGAGGFMLHPHVGSLSYGCVVTGTCHGVAGVQARLMRKTISSWTSVQALDLYNMEVNYSEGDWFEPVTSVFNPGLTLTLYS